MRVLDWLDGRDSADERAVVALERIAAALERLIADTLDPWTRLLDEGKSEHEERAVSWPLEADEPSIELSHPSRTPSHSARPPR